jgi:hypothetical protein
MSMKMRPLLVALPASLIAAAGLAWFAVPAGASNGGPQLAQAQTTPPAATPPGATPPAAGPELRTFSPRKMCLNQNARRVGQRAYMKERLELKPEQMALWTAFEKASDDASAKQKATCATLPAEIKGPVSLTDRMGMQETFMKSRLERLQAVKPSLTALYASLTPEQREVLDRSGGRRGGRGGHHRHHR